MGEFGAKRTRYLGSFTVDPTPTEAGQWWYNRTTDMFSFWDGSQISLVGGGVDLSDHSAEHEPDGADVLNLFLLVEPGTDHTASGYVKSFTVGENVDPGDVLYQKSDGKWWKADADAEVTMPGAAVATQTITADNAGYLLFYGIYRDDSWAWTPGVLLYVSVTPGPPTDVRPSGSGDQVQVFGLAVGTSPSSYALVNPSYELVEIS